MYFKESNIAGKIVRFADLEKVMYTLEMIRGGQWDWERVTYDHKFENRDTGDIYYLRVQGVAVKGEIEQSDAEIQLKTPILGHHYYPHGIEYDEEFPDVLVRKCNEKLSQLKELLDDIELAPEKTVEISDVTPVLISVPGVINVSNLHLWNNESGEKTLSCHLIVDSDSNADQVLRETEQKLQENFGIEHTTIQIERNEVLNK
ncbi:MAG TPA: YugN family protein [Bacillales bacterium]|nr:YugN family protein [Bacillales bacterium]